MKKVIFMLATIIIVSFVATFYLLKEDTKKELRNETNQSEVNKDLNQNIENKNNTPEVNDDNLKNNGITTDKIVDIKDNNQNLSTNSSNNESSNIKDGTTNNNTNNQNNSTTVTVKDNYHNSVQKNEDAKEKSCTPKKFDMSFVRADFNTMAKCTETGDKYKNLGYGYFCDFYQDDCGDIYYMLTLYERNTGVEFDFHNIELPN